MAISASEVKRLRDETQAGMMDCKRALQEADGDFEKAKDLLRQRGIAKSAKRAERATGEGVLAIAVADDQTKAAVVELNCETDFVARNEDFRALAQQLAERALAHAAQSAEDLDAADELDNVVGRIGEAIRVGRVLTLEAQGPGIVASYLHTATYKKAALIELGTSSPLESVPEGLVTLGRELGMQIVSLQPSCVAKEDVPAELVERERNVLREAEDIKTKPPQIQDKIITGRLDKGFYQNVCLLEQPYVREQDLSVSQHVAATAKSLGLDQITVRRFERFVVGAGEAQADAAADDGEG